MMLRPDGQVLIVGPSRGTTMMDFKAKAEVFFTCEVDPCQAFKELVDKTEVSDTDLRPHLMKLTFK
jgi:hypothetical protein